MSLIPKALASEPGLGLAHERLPLRVSEVLSALSFALDLTEGQTPGHSVRSCIFGMRLAKEIGLPFDVQGDLYYALLMKDAGCSTNASRMFQILGTDDIKAKRDVKTTDWTRLNWESLSYALSHVRTEAPFLERVRAIAEVAVNQKRNAKELVQMRCERGAAIARRIGLSEVTATAIHSPDELWNGCGQPAGLRGEEIPLLSRIMNLVQTLDVFYTTAGPAAAVEVAWERRGRWFDPDLVRAFESLAAKPGIWADLENASTRVVEMEPRLDVLDAKSPFTYCHSTGVAGAAVAIARRLELKEEEVTLIRRAALLHDIGKLGVSNAILDKPGKLTDDEWTVVRKHPYYSLKVLSKIPSFGDLSEIAASHHEKLDGSGYFRNMTAEQLSLPTRIIVVSDIYDALAAKRPYRDVLPLETVFGIMQKDAPKALDGDCFEALKFSCGAAGSITADLLNLSSNTTGKVISCVSV